MTRDPCHAVILTERRVTRRAVKGYFCRFDFSGCGRGLEMIAVEVLEIFDGEKRFEFLWDVFLLGKFYVM